VCGSVTVASPLSSKPGRSLPAAAGPKSQPVSNETIRVAGPAALAAHVVPDPAACAVSAAGSGAFARRVALATGPRALSSDQVAIPAAPLAAVRRNARRGTGACGWLPAGGLAPILINSNRMTLIWPQNP
jgi:hypothetical protein